MNISAQKLSLIIPFNFTFPLSKRTVLYPVLLLISLLFVSCLLFYIFQVEKLTKGNYLIKTYNKEIEILNNQNLILEKRYNELASLKNLEKEIESLNLTKVSEITYIPIVNPILAARKDE